MPDTTRRYLCASDSCCPWAATSAGRGRGDIGGDPGEIAERLQSFAEAGYSEAIVWLGPMNERGLDRLAQAVAIIRA